MWARCEVAGHVEYLKGLFKLGAFLGGACIA
jgi:hypothetical protein